MAKKGNPYLTIGLRERRKELLRRLKKADRDDWDKVLAKFAYDFGLRIEKVEEYYALIRRAGLLD